MHPVRRRKKRPNYGVRTVEVNRGKNGFGFTISGQQPCILSCIVAGSPAERAGLRPGDYLVAVNGQSVSKIPHDDVVRLIGSSFGILKLQIAESYYSDSSDEDVLVPTRPKPKHLLKPRIVGPNRPVSTPTTSTQQNRAAKVVRDLRTGAMFVEQELEDVDPTPVVALARPAGNKPTLGVLPLQWDAPVTLPPPPPRLYANLLADKVPEIDQEEYRALVGYLGTIEMPKELQPGSRLQIVRSCIRKLRAEKRAHTLVLMSIRVNSLVLTNCQDATLAKYPVERVTFCGSGSDDQKRFFGLVTAASQEADDNDSGEAAPSSSCHVFAVELRLHGSHADHAAKADTFKIQCTVDAVTGLCQEFPPSSDPIVAAVKVLYCRTRDVEENPEEEPLVANSPQPSNSSSTTTTASSNSDSGIGFRDDCGNQSDRILMVDVQNQRLHIQQMVNNDAQEIYNGAMNPPKSCKYDFSLPIAVNRSNQCVEDGCSSRLTVRAMPDPVSLSGTAVSSHSRSPLSSASSEDETLNKLKNRRREYNEQTVHVSGFNFESYHSSVIRSNLSAKSNDDMSISSGTNKSEDRVVLAYQPKPLADFATKTSTPINFAGRYHEKSDVTNISYTAFAGLQSCARSTDAMSVDSTQSQDPLLSYKLSPKVFGLSRPVATHSLEDLKAIGVCPMMEGEASNTATGTSFMSARGNQQWGSLQELRSFVANCFEASPAAEHLHAGHEASAEPEEAEKGVAGWSTSFEKLLEDPAGLHTFAEFLKKEFSHENIYFWVACERYRELTSEQERKSDAKAIFDRHLCLGALEPVNVDSHARQVTQESVDEASQTLFLQAQKQIFNLMKFDSYPRFIKSDLYKECLLRQLSGQQLLFPGGEQLDAGLQLHSNKNKSSPGDHKLKKSRSDAEEHRRKSLLPWHRKNRSKSKDRGESDYHMKRSADDTISTRSDVSSSRSSLASWDLALRGSFSRQSIVSGDGIERALCRVILPDGATTVVQTRPNEAVRDLVLRLLDKRGLNYSAFQVFTPESIRPICLDDESCILGNKEVRVEQRVVFRLDLPNRKTVGIKAKPTKTLAEVLRPILHKYGYKLDLVTVCLMSENEVLELNLPVVAVDNQRLQVLTRSADSWKNDAKLKAVPTLDEITNRVFEELLQGKADDSRTTSDQNSVKSEDWGSEHSSGIFGRFLRRDSAVHDKARESRGKSKKTAVLPTLKPVVPEEADIRGAASTNKPVPITKWKAGMKMQGRPDVLSPELYEGLKRAQRSRLEDQRGTEINFELPDFLKDKENAPQAVKKYRKFRKADVEPLDQQQPMGSSHESLSTTSKSVKNANRPVSVGNIVSPFLDQSFGDGVIPMPRRAEEYFLGRSDLLNSIITCKSSAAKIDSSKSADSTINSLDNTVIDASAFNSTLTCDDLEGATGTSGSRPHSDPPPLPPKPKHLPIKASLWNNVSSIPNHPPTFRVPAEITNSNTRCARPNEVKRDPKICRSRRAVYLDQPSSSFV